MQRILLGECCHHGKIQARRCQILTKICVKNMPCNSYVRFISMLLEQNSLYTVLDQSGHNSFKRMIMALTVKHFQMEVKSELEGFSSCV